MSKKFYAIAFLFSLFSFCSEAAAYPPAQNERLVIVSMRTIQSAQATYAATVGNGNYGSFQQLAQENFIDAALASGSKYGYVYQMFSVNGSGTMPAAFYVVARPTNYRKSGRKSFYIDQTGVLRGADRNGAAATVSDSIIDTDCVPFEECAKSSLRTLYNAEITYAATVGNGNYRGFQELYNANLISEVLRSGSRAGYSMIIVWSDAVPGIVSASFTLRATPTQYGGSTRRSFFMDQTGVLRGADKNGAPATVNDPPIE